MYRAFYEDAEVSLEVVRTLIQGRCAGNGVYEPREGSL